MTNGPRMRELCQIGSSEIKGRICELYGVDM
jgi:hypothetical protein